MKNMYSKIILQNSMDYGLKYQLKVKKFKNTGTTISYPKLVLWEKQVVGEYSNLSLIKIDV